MFIALYTKPMANSGAIRYILFGWQWLYLEAQDDGPDEPEAEARVAVHDVMWAHVLQVHSLLSQELQCFVHVFQTVNAHLTLGRSRLWTQSSRNSSVLDNSTQLERVQAIKFGSYNNTWINTTFITRKKHFQNFFGTVS